ncbi:MAG: GNAT family N-acetyltransferase [Myxococcaceae bacterium]|nr:GNAT family N-acetyltransferase [Myxococcaceae bacterium]
MTMKRVDPTVDAPAVPMAELNQLPSELVTQLKLAPVSDEELPVVATLRNQSDPWKARGESLEESLEAVGKLRPFMQVARLHGQVAGYVTIERDGPVPGAAYLRNIVVRPELRRRGVGKRLLEHALDTARDMYRKTLTLRVDPSNASAVSLFRSLGFTTVTTVVSKKSGKLRLLMSREL